MLKQTPNSSNFSESAFPTPTEALLQVLAVARRHKTVIGCFTLAFLALAIAYLAVTPKQYFATAEMIIDPRKSSEFTQDSGSGVVSPVDSAVVESQGEVLKSENVATSVIRQFDLVNNPTFMARPGLLSKLMSMVVHGEPPSEYKRLRQTIDGFENRLTIKRVGVTYLFEIGFTSPDPQQAADVANAVAAAYVADDLDAKYSSRTRAAAWMQDRVKQLGQQASDAEHALDDFRRTNNIISTGGRSLDEQQVAEITSQLSIARASTSETRAKLDRIDQITGTGELNLSVADALNNEVIVKLRDSYLDMSKREADLTQRLGPQHQAAVHLRADMAHVKSSMFDELKRIGEGYRSDFQIAKSREEGLTRDLDKAVHASQTTGTAQVQARQLESAAQSYRALYDNFLQRYGESVQQQSFPLTETRVVTSASAPLKKSQPKTLITLLGATVMGGLLGFGVGWLRESTDRTVRTGSQAETAAEAPVLSSVPNVLERGRRVSRDLAREVLNRPFSPFAEAIREIRVLFTTMEDGPAQVIGFISAVPGEGKSTVSMNLGHLLAKSRTKTLIIDGDLRNPMLSKAIGSAPTRGLAEVLRNQARLGEVMLKDADTGLDILPVAITDERVDVGDLLASNEMKQLVQKLRQVYQIILIDLPPLLVVSDAKASAGLFDGFIMVTEWGKTQADEVARALQNSDRLRNRLFGVVLNKVDTRAAGGHRDYDVSGYLELEKA